MSSHELAKQAQIIAIRKRLLEIINAIQPYTLERSLLIAEARQLQAEHIEMCGRRLDFENDVGWEALNQD